jgi:hypothetical protein
MDYHIEISSIIQFVNDRFYIGDILWGFTKPITCGIFGLWTIYDWFKIQTLTRKKNFAKLQRFV